jgi:transcriptional regulatory protein RtcR
MDSDMTKTVMYSFLGSDLDGGFQEKRWNRWRPNVGVSASTDPVIDTLVLLYDKRHSELATLVAADAKVASTSPGFAVVLKEVELNPYDLKDTFLMMEELRANTVFEPDTNYLLNITTGTHIMQIVCFLMIESKRWPGLLAQCGPTGTRKNIESTITLIDLDLRSFDPIMARYRMQNLEGEDWLKQGIPTLNQPFNTMVSKLQKVASKSRSAILLMGPTGAGKTAMARRLHTVKKDSGLLKGEFVEVNCATLRGDTVMSTLFGHKKGAFTGASENREGLLKKANGGLLFLDEIGELGADEQAMLLHALEDKTFTPLGSDQVVNSDFQLIAGTNKDLSEAAQEGAFRADLLARINTWSFEMPGLRDRLEDIEPNLTYELAKAQAKEGVCYRFPEQVRQRYLKFATSEAALWSGNFRDLTASVERMTTLCEGGVIDDAVVEEEILMLKAAWQGGGALKTVDGPIDFVAKVLPDHTLNLFEHAQLNLVLSLCGAAKSYADLGRQVFGGDVGKNPSQRIRDFLVEHGLSLEEVKSRLA